MNDFNQLTATVIIVSAIFTAFIFVCGILTYRHFHNKKHHYFHLGGLI